MPARPQKLGDEHGTHSPSASEGASPAATSVPESGLQNCETLRFCCLSPQSVELCPGRPGQLIPWVRQTQCTARPAGRWWGVGQQTASSCQRFGLSLSRRQPPCWRPPLPLGSWHPTSEPGRGVKAQPFHPSVGQPAWTIFAPGSPGVLAEAWPGQQQRLRLSLPSPVSSPLLGQALIPSTHLVPRTALQCLLLKTPACDRGSSVLICNP